MTTRPPDPLLAALEAERQNAPEGAGADAAWRAYARTLGAARRRVLETPPCPVPVLRRVQGLFRERSRPAPSLLRLVFDSWAGAAAATRGTGRARDLRFEGEDAAIDVRISRRGAGAWRLQIAVEPPGAGLSAHLEGAEVASEPVPLDADGIGELAWRGTGGAFEVRVGREGRTHLRAGPVRLE